MRSAYLLSVLFHILAATAWFGGMLYVAFVVVPWLRKGDRATAGRLLRETGEPFRVVAWACLVILMLTGTFNLWFRGVRLVDLVDGAWLSSGFGAAVALKLALFSIILVVSAIHDFYIGPRAAAVFERDPTSAEAEKRRRQASIFGRVTATLALLIIALAVIVVRGWP